MAPKRKAAAPAATKTAKKKKSFSRVVDKACHISGVAVHEDYDCMLNQTNIDNNNNKFYVIQLLKQGSKYVVYTHWGRVGETGQTQTTDPMDLESGIKEYEKKFNAKTKNDWNKRDKFKPVKGKYTLIKLKTQDDKAAAKSAKREPKVKKGKKEKIPPVKPSKLPKDVQELIRLIFTEAKQGLTSSMDATITENGIETPLGVLSIDQVAVGEKILDKLLKEFKAKKPRQKVLEQLSSEFFTAVPHRFGRKRPPVLDSLESLKEKSDLLELMRDLCNCTNKSKASLHQTEAIDDQYNTLGCDIKPVPKSSKEFKNVVKEVKDSEARSHDAESVTVKRVYKVHRAEEKKRFNKNIGNEMLLYHGSRITNWVGLLSRGILLPKVVVSMGIDRTDEGWLGSGIYFGDSDTAAGYAGASTISGSKFMLMARVAMGKIKDYEEITFGLTKPPKGYNSAHGVMGTDFSDHEYVVYNDNQQHIEYLIEFDEC